MEPHWTSLLPPLVAVALAIITRRILWSLFAGVGVGALLIANSVNPIGAVVVASESLLWKSFADDDHLRIFVFTTLMGAMVGVIRVSGGMEGIVDALSPLARTRRGGQLVTWMLGLVVFIDDYANTLLLGHTMQPLADRLKISREKLAYLVDSTAAPVSGLAIISTWIAGEIGYINDGFIALNIGDAAPDGYATFIATIPYRFYVLWALLFVPLVALTGRDFGPMLQAERRAASAMAEQKRRSKSKQQQRHRWINAVLPIAVTVLVTLVLQYQTGVFEVLKDAKKFGNVADTSFWNSFCKGSSYIALVYGSLLGLCSALIHAWSRKCAPWKELTRAAYDGALLVAPALAILWLSWALSAATEQLETGKYLGSLLASGVYPQLLPSAAFILASAVAFSTGTSWGTMGILMPIVIPATYSALGASGADVDFNSPIMLGCIGSVLAGAIFGDHCSPISDTTVLSSQASGCDHLAHVWTQMPYAVVVGVISIVCGTLPVGFGISPWLLIPFGIAVMAVTLMLIGKRTVE